MGRRNQSWFHTPRILVLNHILFSHLLFIFSDFTACNGGIVESQTVTVLVITLLSKRKQSSCISYCQLTVVIFLCNLFVNHLGTRIKWKVCSLFSRFAYVDSFTICVLRGGKIQSVIEAQFQHLFLWNTIDCQLVNVLFREINIFFQRCAFVHCTFRKNVQNSQWSSDGILNTRKSKGLHTHIIRYKVPSYIKVPSLHKWCSFIMYSVHCSCSFCHQHPGVWQCGHCSPVPVDPV